MRKYFLTKGEAQTYRDQKNTELKNLGREGGEFPSWLRVMAQKPNERLTPFGKTIDDAASFYLEHLAKLKKSVPLTQAMQKVIAKRSEANGQALDCAASSVAKGLVNR